MKLPYCCKKISESNYSALFFIDFFNERIRIDDYYGNLSTVIKKLRTLSVEHNLTKEIITARREDWHFFLTNGYLLEGVIPNYFNGEDAFLMVSYLTNERRNSQHWRKEEELIKKIKQIPYENNRFALPARYTMHLAASYDCLKLAKLYEQVFPVYPLPMGDFSYLQQLLKEGNLFAIIVKDEEIVSAAAAHINAANQNAELTDCATLEEERGNGLMQQLLLFLEKELQKRKIFCSYSIARAQSYGMNACLKRLGYNYNGRLANNWKIDNSYEDMNIWVRRLL